MEQQLTAPLCIVSGPIGRLDDCARALAALGGEVMLPEGHGLPSHPDPLTAAQAGAPNSGHTPGTLHPEELHYIVAKGDHKAVDAHPCTKVACEHVGQTEPRPNPLTEHVGRPYEDDPGIGFLAVTSDNPTAVGEAAATAGWMLRLHASPVLQTIDEPISDEDRLALIEQQLAALKAGRA